MWWIHYCCFGEKNVVAFDKRIIKHTQQNYETQIKIAEVIGTKIH